MLLLLLTRIKNTRYIFVLSPRDGQEYLPALFVSPRPPCVYRYVWVLEGPSSSSWPSSPQNNSLYSALSVSAQHLCAIGHLFYIFPFFLHLYKRRYIPMYISNWWLLKLYTFRSEIYRLQIVKHTTNHPHISSV